MTKEEAIKILMGGEIVTLNCDIKYYTEAIKMAIKALEQEPTDKSYPEYEYIEVRSFAPDSNASDIRLCNYLHTGYEFVRASEFVPSQGDKAGYIEYILRRKKEEVKNEI